MKKDVAEIKQELVQLVRQEEEMGCGIACLAMVLGVSYYDVRKNWTTNFNQKAFKSKWYGGYLYDHGYTVVEKRLKIAQKVTAPGIIGEMLAPFAPLHIVSLQQSAEWEMSHAVVMDAYGKFYDPAGHSHEEVRNSVYAVPVVYGIWETVAL